MARIVFGADFVNDNCVILGNVNVNSPLVWDATMTTSLRAYARANQAAVIVPFILGGAMGPVTNAGAIAQSLAETMAGCALTQLERPGAPVIFGNFLSSMSLRSGAPTFGTPEPAIGSMVIGQLARRLNLPLPFPNLFTAVLRATVAPAQAGVAVNFYVGGQLVGTAVTDATGTATLNANLSVFQIVSPIFTATTVLGGTAVSSTAALLPCIPPI